MEVYRQWGDESCPHLYFLVFVVSVGLSVWLVSFIWTCLSSGSYSRGPQTGAFKHVFISHRSGGGGSGSAYQHRWGLGRTLLQVTDCGLSLCPCVMDMGQEANTLRDALQPNFICGIFTFMTLILVTFQRSHLLIPSYQGIGFQHVNFGRTQTFSP